MSPHSQHTEVDATDATTQVPARVSHSLKTIHILRFYVLGDTQRWITFDEYYDGGLKDALKVGLKLARIFSAVEIVSKTPGQLTETQQINPE